MRKIPNWQSTPFYLINAPLWNSILVIWPLILIIGVYDLPDMVGWIGYAVIIAVSMFNSHIIGKLQPFAWIGAATGFGMMLEPFKTIFAATAIVWLIFYLISAYVSIHLVNMKYYVSVRDGSIYYTSDPEYTPKHGRR